MATTVYTVGYEKCSPTELIETLAGAGVTRLVDVREVPYSRRPGFSKADLAGALGEADIDYTHVKALGNPKENRERYHSGEVELGAEVYRHHLLDQSRDALIELAKSLTDGVACLLCFERDHSACHRDVIADELRELCRDLTVVHLWPAPSGWTTLDVFKVD